MNDILPSDIGRWRWLEGTFRTAFERAGFHEVRTPIVEPTNLFVRAVGETTDVVEKEMYAFERHDEGLTIRPEGTAGAARAYIEHSIYAKEPISRWYYIGPMFRGERPAKGRYRQFYQAGAEIFGDHGPGCDAELIDLLHGVLTALGLVNVDVIINSLGGAETRARFKEELVKYLEPHRERLSTDSQRRLASNPLRILDSKAPQDREISAGAPTLHEFLTAEDQAHFNELRQMLDRLGTPYRVDPHLVRGLDYYTRTLFEVKAAADKLGAGDTVLGGGRYDGLVEDLGGPKTPAIGFAAGLERLLIATESNQASDPLDVYIAALGNAAQREGLVLARDLRAAGFSCEVDTRGTSIKSQLRRSEGLAARAAIILGDAELAEKVYAVKNLAAHTQSKVAAVDVVAHLSQTLRAAT